MPPRPRSGTYVTTSTAGETVRAFLPDPLPPVPPLALLPSDLDLLERANRALGRLDGITDLLPDPGLFVYVYLRKEAVLSSQIEGTQSSLSDLLLHESDEAPGVPVDDVREVSNYLAALSHGLRRMREGFPLSLRLIKEIHEVLLSQCRGSEKQPGEFRRSQNWIGGTRPGNARYVPPPPDRLMNCLGPFELFLHDQPERTPLLIKAALAHVQFDTIHPFLDGNGRLGRLLITLLLCAEGALAEPTLYLSLFFKTHREVYYDLLQRVRTHGEWEEWLRFFLDSVQTTAEQAVATARAIKGLFQADWGRIQGLGRAAGSAHQVHEVLKHHVILSMPRTGHLTGLSAPTVSSTYVRLVELGVVREITGRQRGQIYAYGPYLDLLSQGTEPQR
jgi:Fic family protein